MDSLALYVSAARVGDAAELVRACAGRLSAHAGHLAWRSPAAVVFAERLDALVVTLRGDAVVLDELAERFRARAAALAGSA